MPQSPPVAAPRVLFYVDGSLIAAATKWTIRQGALQDEIFGIDEIDNQEISPGIVRVAGSVDMVRRVGDGGAEGYGLMTTTDLLPRKQYGSMLLLDRQTKQQIFRFDGGIVFEEQSWSMQAKGLMLGSVTFKGTRWANEVTGSRP